MLRQGSLQSASLPLSPESAVPPCTWWHWTAADPRVSVRYRMEILSQPGCSPEAGNQAGRSGRGKKQRAAGQGAERPLFRVTPEDCPELPVCGLSRATTCMLPRLPGFPPSGDRLPGEGPSCLHLSSTYHYCAGINHGCACARFQRTDQVICVR